MSTVLLVDDESDNLWVLQLLLEEHGHHVLFAEDGDVALRKAARHVPELIVTDWEMPGMNGVELCERLKLYPALAQIPVVMVSARAPPEGEVKIWNAFLRKPIDLDSFDATVSSFLAKRLRDLSRRSFPSDRAMSRWQPICSKCWP
ncbi:MULTISPECIES: response regulator [Paraburkholderia]|uniref:response regulator n=1 Tax=Paraburkholderia TaxID=1822464 RepID=UPI00037CAC8B|nr:MULTISPECIES: response regulator [Paraburkholderia]MDH6149476.1 CheY-like chemotaxis protein [Paraburkholderia sp. WSM4179]